MRTSQDRQKTQIMSASFQLFLNPYQWWWGLNGQATISTDYSEEKVNLQKLTFADK